MITQLHRSVEDDRHHPPLEDVPCHPEGEWLIHHLVGGLRWHLPLDDALLRPIVDAARPSGMVFLTEQCVHFSGLIPFSMVVYLDFFSFCQISS
jgi:hypothetical protein